MPALFDSISLQNQSEKLQALNEHRPKLYRGLVFTALAVGYLGIGLLPLTTLITFFSLVNQISAAKTVSAWLALFIPLGILGLSGFMSFIMLRLHVSSPSGLGIKPDKAPKLYELLAELRSTIKHPKLHRVVIHDQYSLEFIPVPRFGLPLVTTNVLHIGLPMMQTLTSGQFKGMLARKLGQYSMQHNWLSHAVYRFRQYAGLYQQAYTKQSQNQWFYLPFKWFFNVYVPWLNAMTVHTARLDELEADTYALQVMSNDEFADSLIRYHVTESFLREKFWPKIHELLQKNSQQSQLSPHTSMFKVVNKGLTDTEVARSLEQLIKQDPDWDSVVPGLHARLDHIGYRNLSLPPPVLESAAQKLLGASLSVITKLMDNQWLSKQGIVAKKPAAKSSRSTEAEPGDDEKIYQSLLAKANQDSLSDDDLWRLGVLTEKLHGKTAAVGIYQQLLKRNSHHAKTWMAIGRILLSQQDDTGIKALERAMELDTSVTAQTSWMLAKYYKSKGNDTMAKRYIEKAGRASSTAAA
ncbi:MAG: hypothetical protein HY080_13785 [Gammaproteobacteria bacterium]|nr:hypothetical protein [Gammaproteobacteria bacterium]